MPSAVCPECEADIHVEEEMDKGDVVVCNDCETKLQVVGLDPIELDAVEEDPEEAEYDGYKKGRYSDDDDDDY